MLFIRARLYSPRFPADHRLNLFFVRTYLLGDELGAGGYGFVMTARHRTEGHEVAVKFIIKSKVPEHAWVDDGYSGRVPAEVMLLGGLEHPNIVKCFELYEDEAYYYMVQELHGTPWVSKKEKKAKQPSAPGSLATPSVSSPPLLTPSLSTESMLDSAPPTPFMPCSALFALPHIQHASASAVQDGQEKHQERAEAPGLLRPPLPLPPQVRPNFARRPSYDLFEYIEQSKYKRLSENQARHIFAQVVEAVHYLDSKGITHCDIKDENLLVDSDLKVKLIDFGSAVWVDDPSVPRPYYHQFYGTTAYASSEILRKMPYRAPPAEIWTLGVLLSYLLTGHSPFPTEQDAIDGRITVRELGSTRISRAAISLMQRCLERDPDRRADIVEVRGHRWLAGALERSGQDQ
ncbi:Pkinase-domain-containing protein [Daedalea quercina L-15889]|uniref:Pkinase-domain-containing protein n=1 Tax=Daedalea quercina L-15889 TaxID=1314783 RepID=A0A165SM00_9APHY|nr:Pkinase-domain-containing protein [Daedalea quercina L-15889]